MTAKACIEATLDAGANTSDDGLATMAGCAVSTVKAYRQGWQRRHAVCGQRLKVPPAVEVEVIALRNDGLTFPVVAQAIREEFGVHLTAAQARIAYNNGIRMPVLAPIPAGVDADDLPLETYSGLMWRLPAKAPGGQRGRAVIDTCDVCSLRPRCVRACADLWWYCGCERPLVWEAPAAAIKSEMRGE